ncbi:MAG TPA: GNAT family N-acetyltransferase [Ktedonobacterales bacterium]|jgi:RimJ/RimL family protein N-acetyltransferase
MMTRLETARLSLRRPTEDDIPVLSGLWRDERVQQYLGRVLTQEAAEERVARLLQSWDEQNFGLWAVYERNANIAIGLCGLSPLEEVVELSYKFAPDFWGRGYATEAATASLDEGFRRLALERIVGMTQSANTGSQRVLEKLGMRFERSLRAWDAEQYFYRLNRDYWLRDRPQSTPAHKQSS